MMLLLDTHVALWAFADPGRLGAETRAAIVDPRNTVAISAISVWEVEIKRALGKLRAPDAFAQLCLERGFDELPVRFEHAERAGRLPPIHADPFDRMLVAQAQLEQCPIVTHDRSISAYDVRVWSPLS
ncbi:MAG: type II toxin-antitoxin system VapC family toxin [Ilumatobacteraceae bacterium]